MNRRDDLNNGDFIQDVPSIKALLDRTGIVVPDMIFGNQSLGAMFENEDYESFPSPRQPKPGREDFLHFDFLQKLWLSFFQAISSG